MKTKQTETGRGEEGMKKRCCGRAIAIAAALLFTACGQGNTAATMHLAKARGEVGVADAGGRAVEVREQLGLYSGYRVDTREDSYAWIDLDSVKLTKMDEGTEVEILKKEGRLEILVHCGGLFFHIKEPLTEEESLEIRTSNMVVGIRGTCGFIEVLGEDRMRVCILEGTVECFLASGEAREPLGLVTAGEKAELTVRDGMGEITVEPLEEEDIPSYVEEEELPEDAVVEAAPEEGPEDGTLEARELEPVNPESEEPTAEGTEAPEGEEAGGNEPPEMPVDEDPIEESALAGSYSPSAGGAALALSIYTDEGDEGEIGVAEGAYSGPIVNVRTNVYRIITDTEEEILLGVSTGEDGNVVIRLYADGAYVDEYVMTEHFES